MESFLDDGSVEGRANRRRRQVGERAGRRRALYMSIRSGLLVEGCKERGRATKGGRGRCGGAEGSRASSRCGGGTNTTVSSSSRNAKPLRAAKVRGARVAALQQHVVRLAVEIGNGRRCVFSVPALGQTPRRPGGAGAGGAVVGVGGGLGVLVHGSACLLVELVSGPSQFRAATAPGKLTSYHAYLALAGAKCALALALALALAGAKAIGWARGRCRCQSRSMPQQNKKRAGK